MPPSPTVVKKIVSSRELYICDHFVDDAAALRVGELLPRLDYQRTEKSRADLPVSGAAAEITEDIRRTEPFFDEMRRWGEDLFQGEAFKLERIYVNSAVRGDMYYAHRDCHQDLANVTVLYYGNLEWHADWGGETLFFSDRHDAELAVTPRPGRLVISRGAILHRAGVPSKICDRARFTVACKLTAMPGGPIG
ncbi:MAG TPA: 2OG-Fe(II) oxygenase [Rhizomicrobium sp.]